MSCEHIENELCAYHFGVIAEDARGAVEEHLLECRECLRGFLQVKRAIELDEDAPRPSAKARQRLRRAVAHEVAPEAEPWVWWQRPLAFAFAGSALAVAMVAVQVLTSGPGAPPHGLSGEQAITGSGGASP